MTEPITREQLIAGIRETSTAMAALRAQFKQVVGLDEDFGAYLEAADDYLYGAERAVGDDTAAARACSCGTTFAGDPLTRMSEALDSVLDPSRSVVARAVAARDDDRLDPALRAALIEPFLVDLIEHLVEARAALGATIDRGRHNELTAVVDRVRVDLAALHHRLKPLVDQAVGGAAETAGHYGRVLLSQSVPALASRLFSGTLLAGEILQTLSGGQPSNAPADVPAGDTDAGEVLEHIRDALDELFRSVVPVLAREIVALSADDGTSAVRNCAVLSRLQLSIADLRAHAYSAVDVAAKRGMAC